MLEKTKVNRTAVNGFVGTLKPVLDLHCVRRMLEKAQTNLTSKIVGFYRWNSGPARELTLQIYSLESFNDYHPKKRKKDRLL